MVIRVFGVTKDPQETVSGMSTTFTFWRKCGFGCVYTLRSRHGTQQYRNINSKIQHVPRGALDARHILLLSGEPTKPCRGSPIGSSQGFLVRDAAHFFHSKAYYRCFEPVETAARG
jgi:hypothetical protein